MPSPLGHEAVLVLLLQLAMLLGLARFLGEWLRKRGQPAVIGELMAGLLLGASGLGRLSPVLESQLFPPERAQTDLLASISFLGVILLLIVTGLEVDLQLIVRKARSALSIAVGSMAIPLIVGYSLGMFIPAEFLAASGDRLAFSAFLAVALSISAIPVIAKVLLDLKLIRRDIGQVILAAAMAVDTIGWLLLAVVAAIAEPGGQGPHGALPSLLAAIALAVLSFLVGPWLMSRFLALVDDAFPGTGSQLSALVFAALLGAAATHYLGLEAVLGAFVVGIVAGQAPRLHAKVAHSLEQITSNLMAPIFFASAGLKVDLWHLLSPRVFLLAVAVIASTLIAKYVGCYLGGWAGGISHWERLAVGSGMSAGGAMMIIVATVGLRMGVLSQDFYSILVSMAMVTSVLTPPLLRWTLSKVEMGPEERRRLEQEGKVSFVRSLKRILLPSRGGDNVQYAAQLIGQLTRRWKVEVTTLFVQLPDQGAPEAGPAVSNIDSQFKRSRATVSQVKVVKGKGVAETILAEAAKGYNLIVLGASQDFTEETLSPLPPMVDRILQGAPCATLIVRAHPDKTVQEVRRILVPVVGTNYSNHAVELAAVVALTVGATITIAHVVPDLDEEFLLPGQRSHAIHREFGEHLVDAQADLVRHLGTEADTVVMQGNSPESLILELARSGGYGLILMGTNLRPHMKRAFLGHRVESLLRHAPCAVAVISSL